MIAFETFACANSSLKIENRLIVISLVDVDSIFGSLENDFDFFVVSLSVVVQLAPQKFQTELPCQLYTVQHNSKVEKNAICTKNVKFSAKNSEKSVDLHYSSDTCPVSLMKFEC